MHVRYGMMCTYHSRLVVMKTLAVTALQSTCFTRKKAEQLAGGVNGWELKLHKICSYVVFVTPITGEARCRGILETSKLLILKSYDKIK